jgi:hypothetical protein
MLVWMGTQNIKSLSSSILMKYFALVEAICKIIQIQTCDCYCLSVYDHFDYKYLVLQIWIVIIIMRNRNNSIYELSLWPSRTCMTLTLESLTTVPQRAFHHCESLDDLWRISELKEDGESHIINTQCTFNYYLDLFVLWFNANTCILYYCGPFNRLNKE